MARGKPPHWIFLTEVNSVNSHCHLPHAPQKNQRDDKDDEHRAASVTWKASFGTTIIPFQLPQHHCWLEPPGQHLWPSTAPASHPQRQEKPLEQTGHHRAAPHSCSPWAVTAAKWHFEPGHGHCPLSPRTHPGTATWESGQQSRNL